MTTTTTTPARRTIEGFLDALRQGDLDAALACYAPDAAWDIHVPGADGRCTGPEEISGPLAAWFINRQEFAIGDYKLVEQGNTVALHGSFRWREEDEGKSLVCYTYQGHFFEVQDERIRQHHLYCTGVRAQLLGG